MKDMYSAFYVIQTHKRGNMDIYRRTLIEQFGKELTWKEVGQLPEKTLRELMYKLKNNIKIEKSPYDIGKLSYAIQTSRSGVGGSAMTRYTCNFCGEDEMWGNTAVPNICKKCADKMAERIVLAGRDLLKENYE